MRRGRTREGSCSTAAAPRSTTRPLARRAPRRSTPGSPRTRPHVRRSTSARSRSPTVPLSARRRRFRPPHVPLRPVGLGQDLRARHDPRAAPARDHAPDRHPRPELRLRAPRPAARRRGRVVAARYAEAARGSRSGAQGGGRRAAPRPLRRLDAAAQAAVLRLDPIADREEYASLSSCSSQAPRRRALAGAAAVWAVAGLGRPRHQARGARLRNLGITAGRSGRSATRHAPRPRAPAGRAASSSTSARWTRPRSRRSSRRACSPRSGGGGTTGSRSCS